MEKFKLFHFKPTFMSWEELAKVRIYTRKGIWGSGVELGDKAHIPTSEQVRDALTAFLRILQRHLPYEGIAAEQSAMWQSIVWPEKNTPFFDLLYALCRSYEGECYYSRVMPEKMLQNARRNLNLAYNVKVAGMLDMTVFTGSAKKAVLLCDTGIYWKNTAGKPDYISWNEFRATSFSIKTSITQFGIFFDANHKIAPHPTHLYFLGIILADIRRIL